MANEATLWMEYAPPIPFTVTDGTGIEKGTIGVMSDPMTAAANTGIGAIVAGIAASEKIASDGTTKLGFYRQGIFKVTASGTINVGAAVCTSVGNKVEAAAVNEEDILGTAFETASDGETLLIELNPRGINLA